MKRTLYGLRADGVVIAVRELKEDDDFIARSFRLMRRNKYVIVTYLCLSSADDWDNGLNIRLDNKTIIKCQHHELPVMKEYIVPSWTEKRRQENEIKICCRCLITLREKDADYCDHCQPFLRFECQCCGQICV